MAALLILAPILAVVLLNLPPRRFADPLVLPVGGLLCLVEAGAALLVPAEAWHGLILHPLLDPSRLLGTPFPIDATARVMFLAIALVGLCTTMVVRVWRPEPERSFKLGSLLILILAAMNGVVLARDLFTLYVFLEITAIASLVLIVLERGPAAFEGAFKYMVLGAVATSLLLTGLALFFILAGSARFDDVARALAAGHASRFELVAIALFLAGLAIKGGLVPFHGWLPDAYSASPAPVSVLLAGIVTKTTGVYTLIRLVAMVGHAERVRPVLLTLALASIVVGALAALGQRDLKRMLGYSSVSQVGYIVLGLAVGTPLALAGAVFHLFNHAVFKSLLFVNAAAVEGQAGTRDMDQLGGLGSRMPVTSTTSILALLSTAGLPPLAGFWSKLFVVVAAWQAGFRAAAAVAVLASVLTLAYFLSMQRRVFFGKVAPRCQAVVEVGPFGLVPALLLAAVTVGLGLGAPWLFQTFLLPLERIL
jgi:multicomponent Na+:H+ antiporter subunit D